MNKSELIKLLESNLEKRLSEYKAESLSEDKLNKKDIAYQLSIDYSGRTKPKVKKLNKKEIAVFYGYRIDPDDVVKSIQKVSPGVKLKHKSWANASGGGGIHTFIIESTLSEASLSSIESRLTTARKGAKASGGGYSGWVKLSGKTWKNKKTGKMMHSQALASHIGGFNDFKIIGESRTNKGYTVVYRDNAFDKTYTAQFPAGITRDTITKTLKKLIRVGLQIIDISPIKEAKLEKEKFTDPDQMRMSEAFKKGDKVKYLGHPATITKVKEYNGKLFYSVSYNKGNGKTKASNILSTDGTITEASLDPKAKKFLDIIKRSKSIRDLKDISVQATPKGNWEVSYKGKSLFTMDGKLLDDETIEKYGLRESAPGYKHDCASKVVHETYGKGTCIPEKHTLIKEGNKYVVTHYDVLFENGKTVHDIPVEELKIVTQNEHWHKNYKKKKKKKNEANVNVNRSTEIEVDGEIYEKHRGKWHGPSRGEVYKSSEMKDIIKKAKKVNVLESVNESDAEYAKSLQKIAKDKQLKMLSKKDKETLLKIAKLMKLHKG